jgi:hypothetical protein
MTEPCVREISRMHPESLVELDWCASHNGFWAFSDEEPFCVAVCPTCIEFKGLMMPSHYASPNCESGKHNHCSCSICF